MVSCDARIHPRPKSGCTYLGALKIVRAFKHFFLVARGAVACRHTICDTYVPVAPQLETGGADALNRRAVRIYFTLVLGASEVVFLLLFVVALLLVAQLGLAVSLNGGSPYKETDD